MNFQTKISEMTTIQMLINMCGLNEERIQQFLKCPKDEQNLIFFVSLLRGVLDNSFDQKISDFKDNLRNMKEKNIEKFREFMGFIFQKQIKLFHLYFINLDRYIKRKKKLGENPIALRQQQNLLLLLHNASMYEDENCHVNQHCSVAKSLWEHIQICNDHNCKIQHCVSSKRVLSHYYRCKDKNCCLCVPVRKAIEESIVADSLLLLQYK